MEESTFYVVCTMIVLFVSTITSICTIVTLAKNSGKKLKEKHDSDTRALIIDTLKASLPDMLYRHDLEVRDRYKADREKYLNDIKEATLEDMRTELAQVKLLCEQLKDIKEQNSVLAISARDVLRVKIMSVYNKYRDEKSLPINVKERLDQFYKDYKALNGNSYIDKYYARTLKWKIIDDNYNDDEIV